MGEPNFEPDVGQPLRPAPLQADEFPAVDTQLAGPRVVDLGPWRTYNQSSPDSLPANRATSERSCLHRRPRRCQYSIMHPSTTRVEPVT
jgi:hypothetical protein